MATASFTQAVGTIQGTFQQTRTVTADGEIVKNPVLAPAKNGTLTTRTSSSVGTLTMTTGHGIATANKLDLYWLDPTTGLPKARYGITVGTVAVDSVPITGGAGDNLPLVNTVITAMVPQLESFAVTAADMQALVVGCQYPAVALFVDGSLATVAVAVVTGSNGAYTWLTGSGITTPFGVNVVSVYLSHSSSLASAAVIAEALIN